MAEAILRISVFEQPNYESLFAIHAAFSAYRRQWLRGPVTCVNAIQLPGR